MSDVLSTETPVARKRHRCDLCDLPITPGEKYTRQTIITDGRMGTWRNCAECDDVIDAIQREGSMPTEGVDHEFAWEWACDLPQDAVAVAFLERWEQ